MDELKVTRSELGNVRPVTDSHGGGGDTGPRGRRQRRHPQHGRTPDELAFLLRRANVASPTLTETRVELVEGPEGTRLRIIDAEQGTVVGEMTADELARLARDVQVTPGLLREWRT